MKNELMKLEIVSALEKAQSLEITREAEYTLAADMLMLVKGLLKKTKETFDPTCDATNKAHKVATATRKEHQQPLKDAEAILKQKMLDYKAENEVQKIEGISASSKWVAKVVDIKKVPRKYLIVDQKTLDGIAKASKGQIPIPGVEFVEEKSMAVRA